MKFMRRGVSKVIFAPTIAAMATPTAAEIAAGTDLSKAVTDMAGWEFNNSRISRPVLANKFSPQIDGEQTVGDASLTFLEDDGTSDTDSAALQAAYTAVAQGTTGFIILAPTATAAGKKVDVFPVKVLGRNRQWTTGAEMAMVAVTFAVTDLPRQDGVVT